MGPGAILTGFEPCTKGGNFMPGTGEVLGLTTESATITFLNGHCKIAFEISVYIHR